MRSFLFTTAIASAVFALTSFTACAPKTTESNAEPQVAAQENAAKTPNADEAKSESATNEAPSAIAAATNNKVLVAYFSASGVTRGVAEIIGQSTGGTIFEIVPETKYSDDDLNWRNENSRSSVEMKDPSSRPAIVGKVENLSDYDIVFLGYPIWWNVAPHVVNTFIEANDLSGKTVVPFCTAGSSTIDNSVAELRKVLPNAKVLDGKKLFSHSTREDVDAWIKSLDLNL